MRGSSLTSKTRCRRSKPRSSDNGINLETLNWRNYDILVVIDESHNFRNNVKGRVDESGEFRASRYGKLMNEVIKAGVRTKILLLSATETGVKTGVRSSVASPHMPVVT